jgi:hypothetical protein
MVARWPWVSSKFHAISRSAGRRRGGPAICACKHQLSAPCTAAGLQIGACARASKTCNQICFKPAMCCELMRPLLRFMSADAPKPRACEEWGTARSALRRLAPPGKTRRPAGRRRAAKRRAQGLARDTRVYTHRLVAQGRVKKNRQQFRPFDGRLGPRAAVRRVSMLVGGCRHGSPVFSCALKGGHRMRPALFFASARPESREPCWVGKGVLTYREIPILSRPWICSKYSKPSRTARVLKS